MAQRIVSRKLSKAQIDGIRALLEARGHRLRKNPKNRYVAFEARTDAKSIFTLYTSGKLVSTVRDDDGEGLLVEDGIAGLAGDAPAATPRERAPVRAANGDDGEGLAWLAGADETGTGEILGSMILAAACLPLAAVPAVDAVAGHVETKSSRTLGGWEKLGQQLSGLRGEGLTVALLQVPNRIFDVYSKNALLDLAYIRLVADLLALSGLRDVERWDDLEFVLDDYGTGARLEQAAKRWRARGMRLNITTKADDRFLAARTASVWARSARARELLGLTASEDEPIGTGNPGHRETKRWLRNRARSELGWPSFVKASFKTVRSLDGLDPVEKLRPPQLHELLDEEGVAGLLEGRPDPAHTKLLTSGEPSARLRLDVRGRLAAGEPACPGLAWLPILAGGLVLDDDLPLELLDGLLARESGLASCWRVLVGPEFDLDDPQTRSLLAAHAAGILTLQPTPEADPDLRAARLGGLRVSVRALDDLLHVQLVEG